MEQRESWCVLLAGRASARIYSGTADLLVEAVKLNHDEHDLAGAIATALRRLLQNEPFDHLVVGAPEDIWPRIRDAIPDHVLRKLRGTFEVEVEPLVTAPRGR